MNEPVIEIANLIADVNIYIGAQDWEGLDRFLQSVDVRKVNISHLLAILRGTYPVREKLEYWNTLRNTTEDYFDELEIPDILLKGL